MSPSITSVQLQLLRLKHNGASSLAVRPTLLGSVVIYCGKLWCLDWMVWLYEDLIAQNEQHRSWLD